MGPSQRPEEDERFIGMMELCGEEQADNGIAAGDANGSSAEDPVRKGSGSNPG